MYKNINLFTSCFIATPQALCLLLFTPISS